MEEFKDLERRTWLYVFLFFYWVAITLSITFQFGQDSVLALILCST